MGLWSVNMGKTRTWVITFITAPDASGFTQDFSVTTIRNKACYWRPLLRLKGLGAINHGGNIVTCRLNPVRPAAGRREQAAPPAERQLRSETDEIPQKIPQKSPRL